MLDVNLDVKVRGRFRLRLVTWNSVLSLVVAVVW